MATDSEVLLLAFRMVAVHPNAELDRWLAAVLQQDGAEVRGGAKWRPPKEWTPRGVERELIQRALTRDSDKDLRKSATYWIRSMGNAPWALTTRGAFNLLIEA